MEQIGFEAFDLCALNVFFFKKKLTHTGVVRRCLDIVRYCSV